MTCVGCAPCATVAWLMLSALALFGCGKDVLVARPADATGTPIVPSPAASPPTSFSPPSPPVPSAEPSSNDDEGDDDGPTCDGVLPLPSKRRLAVSARCPATVWAAEAVDAPLAKTWRELSEKREAMDPPECPKPAVPRTEAQAKQYVCRPPCTGASTGADQCPAGSASWTIVTQRKDGATTGLFVQPIRGSGFFYREFYENRGMLRVSARVDEGYLVVDEVAVREFVCETDRAIYYPLCGGTPLTVSTRRDPRIRVRVRGGRATLSGPGCDESLSLEEGGGPLVVWDPRARECRTSAGEHPGGWAGCSLQCGPQAEPPTGFKCLTGSHWVCCDGCYCDRGSYDPATHTCR